LINSDPDPQAGSWMVWFYTPAEPRDLRHDPRHLGGGVELSLALPRFGGEVPHQVLVRVAEQVVALRAVAAEVERGRLEDADQVGEAVHHLPVLAELVLVREVRDVDHPLQPVRFGELRDDLIDLVADLLVALQGHHVGEPAARGYLQERVGLAGILVGDVLHEEEDQHVVLVLRGIHPAAQLIATFPE
jgi:hypothetical protein